MRLTKDILRQLIKEEILAGSGSEFLGEKKNKNKRRQQKHRQRSAKRQQFEELKEEFVEKATEAALLAAEYAFMRRFGTDDNNLKYKYTQLNKETEKMRDDNPALEKWVRSEEGQAVVAQVRDRQNKYTEDRVRSSHEEEKARQRAEWEKNKYAMSRSQPW
mgnify:CR=1 FL=1